MYEVPGQTELRTEKVGARTYISGSEKQILEKFWQFFDDDSRFISFNGRQFDGPFLMIRSAIHGVVPKRDLVGYRYGYHPNCDLREALNFFGTTNSRQFKFNLDLACKTFGVETSKSEGIDGRSVETWYRAGRHREIADYCLEDVRATAELYEKVAPTLLGFNKEFRDSEERASRRAPVEQAELPIMLPRSEQTFMDAIEQSSVELTAALERVEAPQEKAVTSKHQAIILDKLVQDERPEEEIPTGI
jgi:predicted PolB exonuclease-like 3'-5' exonuclease